MKNWGEPTRRKWAIYSSLGYKEARQKRMTPKAIEIDFYEVAIEAKHWDDLLSGSETTENV